jgi:hypothetical protein
MADDRMARMQAEETFRDLIYPPPEPGHGDGWESIVLSTEECEQVANLQRRLDPDSYSIGLMSRPPIGFSSLFPLAGDGEAFQAQGESGTVGHGAAGVAYEVVP